MATEAKPSGHDPERATVQPRPELLFPLFQPLDRLPGIGARLGRHLARLLGTGPDARVLDLLLHLPSGLIDRTPRADLSDVEPGTHVTIALTVDAHLGRSARSKPYRIRAKAPDGFVHLVFFHARDAWLQDALPEGARRLVSGPLTRFGVERQMVHPTILPASAVGADLGPEAVYPLVQGLSQGQLRRALAAALDLAPDLPEWHDPALIAREGWSSWREALLGLHRPKAPSDVAAGGPNLCRLAYDELLATQLALALTRRRELRLSGRARRGSGRLSGPVRSALPFALTACQERALAEIAADLAAPERMLRLLQGDVGSGKTVVALLAMLTAIESGGQAALMAPTEVLARQHQRTLAVVLAPVGLRPLLLTGRERGSERTHALAALASGQAALAVGTHALFQDGVEYRDLALAVIDEQHRFGVHQRLGLASKGNAVDLLVMTATPIPRSLVLALYGDMATSELRERPAGRPPIATRALPLARLAEVESAIGRALEAGERVFWICPVIEDDGQLAAALARFEHLHARFAQVGLVHGRMAGPERDAAMAAFADGRVRLLVATTVIEVGIDVPEATVMVVEQAERFGLAQLHQLRGRVGRGHRPSTCLLLYQPPLTAAARARLRALRASDDGFALAEQDLKLRGPGEVLGTRQSGLPSFRTADLGQHRDLLAMARDDAKLALSRDPDLTTPRGLALRLLLHLFERSGAMAYLASG